MSEGDARWAAFTREGDRTATAIIGYTTRIIEEHFARAGRDLNLDNRPTDYWFLYGVHLSSALVPHADVLDDPTYRAFLRAIFADIFDFLLFACEGDPAYELAELHRAFGSGIRCGPILPLLLPDRARDVMEEVDRLLTEWYEEDRRRADQMGY